MYVCTRLCVMTDLLRQSTTAEVSDSSVGIPDRYSMIIELRSAELVNETCTKDSCCVLINSGFEEETKRGDIIRVGHGGGSTRVASRTNQRPYQYDDKKIKAPHPETRRPFLVM